MKTGRKIIYAGIAVLAIGIIKAAAPILWGQPFLGQEFIVWLVISIIIVAIGAVLSHMERDES